MVIFNSYVKLPEGSLKGFNINMEGIHNSGDIFVIFCHTSSHSRGFPPSVFWLRFVLSSLPVTDQPQCGSAS
jgi:hypothetical protein